RHTAGIHAPDDPGRVARVLARVVLRAVVERGDPVEGRRHGHAVEPLLVVQVRPGRAAGVAERTDLLAALDLLVHRDELRREVRVAGAIAVAVVDLDPAPVARAAGVLDARDHAARGG